MQVFRNWQILVLESMFQEISSACVHTFESGTMYKISARVSSNYFIPDCHCLVLTFLTFFFFCIDLNPIPKDMLFKYATHCGWGEKKGPSWAVLAQSLSSNTQAQEEKFCLGGVWRVEQLSDYEKHYMSKRTTTCNCLGVLELQRARCRNVCMPVNVMANSLTT